MKDWWNLGFVLFLLLLGGYLCFQGFFRPPSPLPDPREPLGEKMETPSREMQNGIKELSASQTPPIPMVWMERGAISQEEQNEYLRTLLSQILKLSDEDAGDGNAQKLPEKVKNRQAWREWQAKHRFPNPQMASLREKEVFRENARSPGIFRGAAVKRSGEKEPPPKERDSPEAEETPGTGKTEEEKNPKEPEKEQSSPENPVPEKTPPEEAYQVEEIPYADAPAEVPYAEQGKEEPERPFILHSLQQWEEDKSTITLLLSSNPYADENYSSNGIIFSIPLPDGWKLTSARGNGQFRLQNRECKWFFASRDPLMAELIVMEIQKAEFPYSLNSNSTPVLQIAGLCIQKDGTQIEIQPIPMTTEALSEMLYW